MPKQFKIGDHVRWNSEAGYVTGTIVKYITGASIIKAILIMQQKMTRNMKLKVTNGPCGDSQVKSAVKDQ